MQAAGRALALCIVCVLVMSGCEKEGGRIYIPETTHPGDTIPEIDPIPRTSLERVNIYGPIIDSTFKIVNYNDCPVLSWPELKRIRNRNIMQSIDVVLRITLDECTDDAGTVGVLSLKIVQGKMQAPDEAREMITSVLSKWRYTAFKSGEIDLRINETRNEITYDVSRLFPCQYEARIPNGDLWLIYDSTFTVTAQEGRLAKFR